MKVVYIMPFTYPITVELTPGISSIKVYYNTGAVTSIWKRYEEGQRILQNTLVKFEVTPYNDFTLTSWEALWLDQFGEWHQLPLDSITGESAWTFTMPLAEVRIKCEATAPYTPGDITWPEYGLRGNYYVVQSAPFEKMYEKLVSELLLIGTPPYPILELQRILDVVETNYPNVYTGLTNTNYLCHLDIGNAGANRGKFTIIVSRNPILPATLTLPYSTTEYSCQIIYYPNGTITHTSMGYSSWSNWCGWEARNFGEEVNPYGGIGSMLLTAPSPGTSSSSIRYIMSPDNSGIVTGPDIYDGSGALSFTYRIKVGYDFKRITVFAVGEPPTEANIEYNLTYDGDTRTYSIEVPSVPAWALGIRVLIETINTIDPTEAIGTNSSDGPIGGDGTYDDSSDTVPLPPIPVGISASDSGFVTLFKPSISQIKDLGNYLWSHLTEFIENLQKMFTNPMDYFIALNIMPVNPAVGASQSIYIGNWITNISMPPVTNQFYEFYCGRVTVREYFGTFLDYAPNTKARIMLPFIGDRDLDVNEIMNRDLQLWYRIDLLSGACVAILTIQDDVYYQWSGNCAVGIPVTGSDWSRLYSAAARTATIGAGIAIGGMFGGAASTLITSTPSGTAQGATIASLGRTFNNIPSGVRGVARERQSILNAMEGVDQPATTAITSHSSRAINGAMIGNIIGHNATASNQRLQHTGDMSGAISIMGNRTPYIVLEYPDVNLPENYKHIIGYPSNQYVTLSSVTGFTKCKTVLFESNQATDDEIEMIISALKGGVYL